MVAGKPLPGPFWFQKRGHIWYQFFEPFNNFFIWAALKNDPIFGSKTVPWFVSLRQNLCAKRFCFLIVSRVSPLGFPSRGHLNMLVFPAVSGYGSRKDSEIVPEASPVRLPCGLPCVVSRVWSPVYGLSRSLLRGLPCGVSRVISRAALPARRVARLSFSFHCASPIRESIFICFLGIYIVLAHDVHNTHASIGVKNTMLGILMRSVVFCAYRETGNT